MRAITCLVLFAAVAALRAADPIQLSPAVISPEGAQAMVVARRGAVLLVHETAGLRRWDLRNGYDLGPLLGPDGKPVVPTAPLSACDAGLHLVIATASQIHILELATLQWQHSVDFAAASGVFYDAPARQLLASLPQNGRNEIHQISLIDGSSQRIARLRGLSRENREPQFTQLRRTADGGIVGIDGRELIAVDPASGRLRASAELLGKAALLPGGRILELQRIQSAGGLVAVFHDGISMEQQQRIPIELQREPRSYGAAGPLAWNAARGQVLVYTDQGCLWLDPSSATAAAKFLNEDFIPDLTFSHAFAWNPQQREFLGSVRTGRWGESRTLLVAWSPEQPAATRQYGRELMAPDRLLPVPGEPAFYVAQGAGGKHVSLRDGRVSVRTLGWEDLPLTISPDGRSAVVADGSNQRLYRLDRFGDRHPQRVLLRATQSSNRPYAADLHLAPAVFLADDGKEVGLWKSNRIAAYGSGGQERFLAAPIANGATRSGQPGLFDSSATTLVAIAAEPFPKDATPRTDLVAYTADTGALIWRLPAVAEDLMLLRAADPGLFIAYDRHRQRLQWRRFADGAVLRESSLAGMASAQDPAVAHRLPYAVSSDRSLLAASDADGRVGIFSLTTGEPVATPRSLGYSIRALGFSGDNTVLACALSDRLVLLNPSNLEAAAALLLFTDDAAWVVATDDQRFDASPEAQDQLYYQQGHRRLPLRLFFERTYTPGLLARRLAGESLPPPDLSVLPIPPQIELTVADFGTRGLVVEDDDSALVVDHERIVLRYAASGGTGLIEEVRIFHNGKALGHGTRGLTVENDVPDRLPERTAEVEVTLVPGENRFSAVAINNDGLESAAAALAFDFRPPQAPEDLPVRLHLLVIGANQYDNPQYNLNYAVPDARAFRDAVLAAAGSLFTEVRTRFLMDADVTRQSIVQTLRDIAHEAAPSDVLIFYYAGHGVMSQTAEPEFFLALPQVTQLYGNDALLSQHGLSASQLRDLARSIPAQKQLFILDACQAAGALQQLALRGAAEQKAIASLARSTGTYWLTATGSDQFAVEFETLGHGVFTYALLEALRGAADDGDAQLSVREIDAFLQSRVPDLTRLHRGSPQYPASYGFGQDFPIAILAP